MKKITFLLFFVTFFQFLFSQKITGFVVDMETQKPVYNVVLKDITNNKIYFSGFNGQFEIISSENQNIVVQFEHLCYEVQKSSFKNGQSNIKIELVPNYQNIEQIIVSANRNETESRKIPYFFEIIQNNNKANTEYFSVDDFLKKSSSLNILRPQGVFTHSPVITSSGMGAVPGRTLVLFDGVSLNKSDDGNVNWNMISASVIDRVEIAKNSFSTVYGNNAMGGIVNFIPFNSTKKGFSGSFNIHGGMFKTIGSDFKCSYNHKSDKGFFVNFNAFVQKSDGFVSTPDSLQSPDVEYLPSYLKEMKFYTNFGYDFNRSNKIEIMANYFDDNRGFGQKINEENGSYTKHTSQFAILKYTGASKNVSYGFSVFGQNENYFKIIESIKNSVYSLVYVNSLRQDLSSNLYLNSKISNFYKITSGLNLNLGKVEGIDEYQTSTDKVVNSGLLKSIQLYVENVFNFGTNDKFNFLVGGNANYSIVHFPEFSIQNGTNATAFMMPFTGVFENSTFSNFSFNSGFRWNITPKISFIGSVNSGFNAPTLDDLTRCGLMRYGFKLANPHLKPEKILNYNSGFKFSNGKLSLFLDASLNKGFDFMYYIETGETVMNGRKKVIQKQNITSVEIIDFNARLNYKIKNFDFFANFTYNDSYITKFDSIPEIEGKKLAYSPLYSARSGFDFKIKNVNISFLANYFSKQFTDNENTTFIKPYYTFDANIGAELTQNLSVNFSAQNLLNYQYVIYDDQLTLGRFMVLSLKLKW